MKLLIVRPPGHECPWCGPAGVPVDRSLRWDIRLCDECMRDLYCPERPLPARVEHPAVVDLRIILANHLRILNSGARWPGMEFAKAHFGRMVLNTLAEFGCDPAEELRRAVSSAMCPQSVREWSVESPRAQEDAAAAIG